MFLSRDNAQQQRQLETFLEDYHCFADFNPAELQLIEALRTLSILHYAAWLGRRRDDPSFRKNFSWFGTDQHILELREQFSALQDPSIF